VEQGASIHNKSTRKRRRRSLYHLPIELENSNNDNGNSECNSVSTIAEMDTEKTFCRKRMKRLRHD